MSKTIKHLVEQLKGIRWGVSPGLLDSVRIEYYGGVSELRHIAITYSENKRIQVTPYDSTLLGQINQALQKSGFNSYIFSKTSIVVNVPKGCGEERDKIVKFIKELGEQAKISIRNIRQKARKELDDKEVQKLTDAAIKEINQLIDSKAKDIK